jgi:hypothetical protein
MATYATFALAQTAAAGAADYETLGDVTTAQTYRDAVRSMLVLGLDSQSMAGRSWSQNRQYWENELKKVQDWLDEHGGERITNSNQAWFTRARPV